VRLYEITLEPLAGLGTPLKGDTIFGHFCWQAARDPALLDGGLERQLAYYQERPFAVFASAFPKVAFQGETRYALKRPDLPWSLMFPEPPPSRAARLRKAKELADRQWMLVPPDLQVNLNQVSFCSNQDLAQLVGQQAAPPIRRRQQRIGGAQFLVNFAQPHNTINRLTRTTGTGPFAPYTQNSWNYAPGTTLALLVLLDPEATDVEKISRGLERIGQCGFGKDASLGWGRFRLLGEPRELSIPETIQAAACYTLAPCVPRQGLFSQTFFTPFVRFGKHGDWLAKGPNPFKNPVIMADEGAVLVPRDPAALQQPYLGTGLSGVSLSLKTTVVQGYTPYLPLAWEG